MAKNALSVGKIYNEKTEHSETCEFKERSKTNKFAVDFCGIKAFGEYKGTPFCVEHFNLIVAKNGVIFLTTKDRVSSK
jgi:hypothetical protein